MNSNLYKVEQSLRSMAKRYKSVKYSIGLAILFLMIGGNAFTQEINSTVNITNTIPTAEEIKSTKNLLKNSIENLQTKIKNAREENNKGIGNLRLELIQLTEQGDQVVKSPWNSWQFGANYFYNNWRGTYEGKSDKKEKYPFEGVFTRSSDLFLRNIHPDSKHYAKYTSSSSMITHSLSTLSVGGSQLRTFGETPKPLGTNPTLATTSARGGDGDSYGLENSIIRQEDISKIELGVTIKQKELNKNFISPSITKPEVSSPQEPGNPAQPNTNLNVSSFSPLNPMPEVPSVSRGSNFRLEIAAYNGMIEDEKSFWNETTSNYIKGVNGNKNDAKSYNHNSDAMIDDNTFKNKTSALLYTNKMEQQDNGIYNSVLFKSYFDYGSINTSDNGGGTLRIAEGTNITIDSINNTPNKESETDIINKQAFLVGGSRVGSLNNAANAAIENSGKLNLTGPLTIGLEMQTNVGGYHTRNAHIPDAPPTTETVPNRENLGTKKLINEEKGVISDSVEEGYRDNGLGGLTVGKVNEKGEVVNGETSNEISLNLPQFNLERDIAKIKRTPDIINSKTGEVTKGGYTGYKTGMLLTSKDTDGTGKYEITNKGTISFNGKNSTGILINALRQPIEGSNNSTNIEQLAGGLKVLNDEKATITVNGIESYGMQLASRVAKLEQFENKGTINVGGVSKKGDYGSASSGMALLNRLNYRGELIKAPHLDNDEYDSVFKNSGTINVSGGTGNSGMDLYAHSESTLTNSGIINVSGKLNTGMRVSQSGKIDGEEQGGGSDRSYGHATPRVANRNLIRVSGGERNSGMTAYSGGEAVNIGSAKISLKGKNNVGMISATEMIPDLYYSERGDIINHGEISTETSEKSENAMGMALLGHSKGTHTGKINLNGKGVVGVYLNTHESDSYNIFSGWEKDLKDIVHEKGLFEMVDETRKIRTGTTEGGEPIYDYQLLNKIPEINVVGENSVGIYLKGKYSRTTLERGKISTVGGVGLYADQGTMEIGKEQEIIEEDTTPDYRKNTIEITAGKGGVLFYNYSHRKDIYDKNNTLIEYNKLLEKPEATGKFVLKNSVIGVVKKGGAAFYLRGNDVRNKVAFLNKMFYDTPDSEGIVSKDGKKVNLKMEEGSAVFVSHNKNINDVTTVQKLSELTVLNSNNFGNRVTIDPASSDKYKIEKSLRNKLEIDTDVNLDDGGTTYNRIEYLASWVTLNSGKKMTSSTDNKVAIFQANVKREEGSSLPAAKVEDVQVINKGNITLTGKNSVAIGTSFGQVTNEKDISVTGENGVGIYGADSSVIKNTGTVEVGKSGTGIYAENDLKVNGESTAISTNKDINITNTGIIKAKTGSTGIYGIYAKNDKVNYNNATATVNHSGTIDLAVNKSSVGIYTENGNLISSGNVSVGENGVAIKVVKSNTTLSSGNINAISGIGVLAEDSTVNANANMAINNGLAMSIKNSKITVGSGTYNLTKSIGFKIGTLGSTDYFKGNGGTLNLGENSIAYQLKDTNLTSNSNFVDNLGINSTGKYTYIYADNSTLNYENQKILNSDGSIFTYAKNSNITLKTNTNISSSNKKVTGIFSENTISGKNIVNNGTINLSGEESLGVYSEGNVNLVNNGKIAIGEKGTGIYSKDSSVENSGEIVAGNNSTGIYAKSVNLTGNSKLSVGNNSVGIYSVGGNINLTSGSQLNVGANNSTGLYYNGSNGSIVNNTDKITVGDNSNIFTIRGQNNKVESNSTGTVNLRNNSMYMYSTDSSGSITNRTNITSSGDNNYGIYSAGKVDNHANIDFLNGVGSIGMYAYYPKNDSYSLTTMSLTTMPAVTNHLGGTINVAKSDLSNSSNERYGIGMAAGHTEIRGNSISQRAAGYIVNNGTISVTHANSIGMYATGRGSIAENRGTIELSGNKRNIGMYLENGAAGYNYGTITTVGSNNNGQIGVAVTTGATIHNYGTININAENGIGIYNFGGGIVKNYGSFVINAPTQIKTLDQADTSKGLGGVNIQVRQDDKSQADIFVNGKKVEPTLVHRLPNNAPSRIATSSIGIYMSSSGINPTRPIENLGALASSGIRSADLIIGTEAAKYTNSKYIQLGQDIIEPYNKMIKEALRKGINKWEIYSGSLTWQATVTQNKSDQTIQNTYMTKIPYTVYASDKNTTRDTYNFTDGLEQRYGVEAVGSREKELFNKLNHIGNNEGILLKQAFDEMMGHQYANIHQRIQSTGDILDKEFTHLRKDWATASKKSHKVKTFGARGEYKTNTAGVINTTNNAYGVAYVHENEDIKLGKGFGYYTGLVYNTYKFKDIGRSKEEMLEVKVGAFKSIPFDYNNSLNWTVSGELSYGYNKMHRKFLVVDEVFNARGRYNTYGVAIKNELGKDFRLTETLSLRPYGAIKVEYMKVGKVKEKSGEIKLDVKGSHYTSVKPELGIEANFKYTMLSGKIITARLGTAFEDELGKVAKANNKARVANTSADWFNLPKEKEDRKGNIKTDFSIGLEGDILGGTANIGYDTKGNNIRGGLGVRIIF
ncbi:autotransporter-associated N-terminal domain-containing protein [Fusobacterium canifelinum]|uniref:autotransporter-associated N-terminal domain-containing protein n=1 Tax=Fusobacterium canifelinum TaxID=285729 RepID=UPI0030D46A64